MHILRKIVLSRTEPERNVLWIDPDAEAIKYFNGGWKVLCGRDGEDTSLLKNAINALQEGKQDILVSGGTIKTVNGLSLLGSGDIKIEASSTDEEDVRKIVESMTQDKYLLQDSYLTTSEIDGVCAGIP